MKKLKIFKLSAIITIAVLGFTTCQKFDEVPPDGKSPGMPKLLTINVDSITANSAYCGGYIIFQGSTPVTARGICWSNSQNPTTSDYALLIGSGIGNFTCSFTGLAANTMYYVRAFATNSIGTSYGEQKSFITDSPTLATVITSPVSTIISSTAKSGGNVNSSGGVPVIARGVCWSINENPTITDEHTTDGNGTGHFSSSISGLTINTLYYVRAYATNSTGTSYGNQQSFNSAIIEIGANYAGGIVFYVDEYGQHGLVCSETDQSTGAQWGCYGTAITGTSTEINTGNTNTTSIITKCETSGTAANICYNLYLNTFSDWYLPSKDELNLMYINLKSKGIGNFENSFYWSSSEVATNEAYSAWLQSFSNGQQFNEFAKNSYFYVRAVRSF